MTFSGKIEDGTSNKSLNIGSNTDHGGSIILSPMIQKAEQYSSQGKYVTKRLQITIQTYNWHQIVAETVPI